MAEQKRNPKIQIGQRFGRWTVLRKAPMRSHWRSYWFCVCDCGTEREIRQESLQNGKSASCGCLHREISTKKLTTHGMVGSPEYSSWESMRARIKNPNNVAYHYYGGRGLTICAYWLESFQNFYADMGPRPAGLSIERLNNDGGYWCGHCQECAANGQTANCVWATREQQLNNRRTTKLITFQGRTQTVTQWAREIGIHKNTLAYRVTNWSVEEALTKS